MSVFATIRETHPTIRLGSKGGRNKSTVGCATIVSEVAGDLLTKSKPASCSKLDTIASASAWRPMTTSHLGDSGSPRLRYHATMAPTAPNRNMTRHPKIGTNNQASRADTGSPAVTIVEIMPDHRPRIRAGKNSAIME